MDPRRFAIVYTIEGELIQRAQVYASADDAAKPPVCGSRR
jgi:hypothetical protein